MPRTLIINMPARTPHPSPPIPSLLSLGLPLEFLQSSCGLRTACGPGPAPGPCVGKGSCEAEHMLCPWFPFPPPLLIIWAAFNGAVDTRVHYQSAWPKASSIFMHIYAVRRSRASPAIRPSSPPFLLLLLLLLLLLTQYLSQSHFAACCSIANNIN